MIAFAATSRTSTEVCPHQILVSDCPMAPRVCASSNAATRTMLVAVEDIPVGRCDCERACTDLSSPTHRPACCSSPRLRKTSYPARNKSEHVKEYTTRYFAPCGTGLPSSICNSDLSARAPTATPRWFRVFRVHPPSRLQASTSSLSCLACCPALAYGTLPRPLHIGKTHEQRWCARPEGAPPLATLFCM